MKIEIRKSGLLKYKNFVCKCTIGKKGIKSEKREGDNTTPRGTFSLGKIYYRKDRVSNVQSKLKKKKIMRGMGWCHDVNSKRYNRESKFLNYKKTENLFRQDLKYDIFVVINYNSNPVKIGRGSAIFLHLTKNYAPTKGCVAMAKKNLIYLLSKIQKNTKIKIY